MLRFFEVAYQSEYHPRSSFNCSYFSSEYFQPLAWLLWRNRSPYQFSSAVIGSNGSSIALTYTLYLVPYFSFIQRTNDFSFPFYYLKLWLFSITRCIVSGKLHYLLCFQYCMFTFFPNLSSLNEAEMSIFSSRLAFKTFPSYL